MKKNILYLLAIIFLFVACTKAQVNNGNNGEDEKPDTTPKLELLNGDAVISSDLVSFKGGEFILEIKSNSDWTATVDYIDGDEWLNVTPSSGTFKDSKITLKTVKNTQQEDRTARVTIKNEKFIRSLQIVQKGYKLSVVAPNYPITALGRTMEITISSEYKYEMQEPTESWIKFSKKIASKDAIYQYIIDPNTASSNREAKIILKVLDENTTEEINILQEGVNANISPWINKDFFRTSLLVKFSGSTCRYCPDYSNSVARAINKSNESLVTYTICTNDAVSEISYPNSDLYVFYGISGLPTGIFNGMSVVENIPALIEDMLLGLCEESKTYNEHVYFNADVQTSVSDNTVNVDVKAYAKEAGEYRVAVAVVESDIIAKQLMPNGVTNETYHHNHILRKFLTESKGDILKIEKAGTIDLSYSADVSKEITNLDNAKVIVYFIRDIKYNHTNVANVKLAPTKEYIDNVIEVELGKSYTHKFE